MTTPTVNKAAWSLLIDDDGNDAIGKVTASPEANTVLGRLKAIADGGAATVADGADVAQGATTDAAASSSVAEDTTARTSIGLFKGIKNILILLNAKLPSLGQTTKAGSIPVTLSSDEDTLGVSGPLTDAELRASDVAVTLDGEAITGAGISISQTPTVTAGAYSAGDAVGGLLTFANAARESGAGGVITDLLILDDAGQDAEMELWLFNATFTAMDDNAPWAPSEADLRNLVAIVSTADGAWFAAGTPSAARVECSQRYDCAATSLFGQLVTRGTPTYAATDDVTVILGLLTD